MDSWTRERNKRRREELTRDLGRVGYTINILKATLAAEEGKAAGIERELRKLEKEGREAA